MVEDGGDTGGMESTNSSRWAVGSDWLDGGGRRELKRRYSAAGVGGWGGVYTKKGVYVHATSVASETLQPIQPLFADHNPRISTPRTLLSLPLARVAHTRTFLFGTLRCCSSLARCSRRFRMRLYLRKTKRKERRERKEVGSTHTPL